VPSLVFAVALVVMVALGLGLSGIRSNQGPTEVSSRTEVVPPAETPATTPPQAASIESFEETVPEGPVVESASVETASAVEPGPPLPATVFEDVSYADAESAYLERRYDEAVELFLVYTEQHPGNAWGHYMLGLSAWKAGESEESERAFRAALKLDPNHGKSRINLVRLLLDEGRLQAALSEAEEAVELDPENGTTHRMLGRVYHNLGETKKAEMAYREAIVHDGGDVWAMNNLGLLLIEQERFSAAVLPLARAVELEGDVVIFQNNLGIALERLGHYSVAADAYRAALAVDDTNQKVLANLDRVTGLVEDPGLNPIDLAEVASRFVEELEMASSGPEKTQTDLTVVEP
jgi:Flp pilus assembly protein TadD